MGAVASVVAATALVLAPAPVAPFAGTWVGHTRYLDVTRTGRAHEHVDDGCCHRVIDMMFRLARPRGNVVTFRVTAVRLYEQKVYWKGRRRPRVGEVGVLRLRGGVVTESLTGFTFCGPRTARCGA